MSNVCYDTHSPGKETCADLTGGRSRIFYYEVIHNVLQTPSDDATKATTLKQMKAKITGLHHEEQKHLFVNNAERDRIENESPSLYHVIRTRKLQGARTHQAIQDRNGLTHTTMEDITHTLKEYMQTKFDTIPVDGDSLRRLLQSVVKKIPKTRQTLWTHR